MKYMFVFYRLATPYLNFPLTLIKQSVLILKVVEGSGLLMDNGN